MKQEIVISNKLKPADAAADVCSKLKLHDYLAIIFFATSDYDFEQLSIELKNKFPTAEVIGTTTSGEITPDGFIQKTLVVSALSCTKTKVSGLFIPNVNKFKISQIEGFENAAKKIGIVPGDKNCHNGAFALTFVNGLCNAEENLLALIYAIMRNDNFIVAGGSAGDDLKFKATYVSYNGKCTTEGAVILFIKTECAFEIVKENLFTSSGKKMKITQADSQNRKVITIDDENPRKRYAEVLGIPEANVPEATLSHPVGRWLFGGFYISSIASFEEDGTMNMYSKINTGSIVEILNKDNVEKIATETCENIRKKIPNPGCVILVNCILRTIFFQQNDLLKKMNDIYKHYFPTYCGFSSYGEQIGRINSNQTLVAIVIGE